MCSELTKASSWKLLSSNTGHIELRTVRAEGAVRVFITHLLSSLWKMSKVVNNDIGTPSETDDVQDTLTCIQRLMALSGLSWDYQQPKSAEKCCNGWTVASRIYSVMVCIVYILHCIQMIPPYIAAKSFIDATLTIVNHIVTLLSLTYWALSTNIHSKVRIFYKRLREARLKFDSCATATGLRQRMKKACVCITFFAASTIVAIGLCISKLGDTSNFYFWPSLALSSIITGWITLLNHSLLLLFLSISLLLTYEYDNCTLRLTRASEGSVKEEDIEDIRDYHASLTDLVEHVCSLMSRHVAAGYVSSFLAVCFCLYSIINEEKSFTTLAVTSFAVSSSITHLIALTYTGVRLHEAAHQPLNILHDLAGRNMPDRVIGLVTLFTNKLSQRQIGISALGLMTITKDTILTMIGTLLTYVFIVIQFKPESSGGSRQDGNNATAI
ncbi:uncharacterized protein LOC124275060 [Haliotis rubra]|uniref:uncharacterized protein LOC124275060 n=1 Tax=Haliotis rubra TaxID=36100 RepID=UPI001EE5E6DC|nr:uncharacterized protein LOC124275060 [Haliotis rubra]